jgi:hypothetical protein
MMKRDTCNQSPKFFYAYSVFSVTSEEQVGLFEVNV